MIRCVTDANQGKWNNMLRKLKILREIINSFLSGIDAKPETPKTMGRGFQQHVLNCR